MQQGILYVVARDPELLKEAAVSARSAKRAMPDMPVMLATDLQVKEAPFDEVRQVRSPRSALDFFRLRIEVLCDPPFERTLHLDGDTYIARDVSELFSLLERFDLAVAHDTHRIAVPIPHLPESYPELNAGVIAYRAGALRHLAVRWLELYDQFAEAETGSYDQPSLRQALWESDLRVGIVPPEFNCRVFHAGVYNLPVAILHAHASERQFERAAEIMSRRPGNFWWTYVHYDWQVWGPHGSSRRLLDFRDPLRRHRIARAVLKAFGRPSRMPFPRR
jgi:hypothetical protein